jgi:hypothetical protein
MKVQIFSVIERKPPIDEQLIKWEIDNGNILGFSFVEAYIAIPDDEEELSLIPKGVSQDMIWSDGFDMMLNDHWSYSVTTKGE